MSLNTFGHLAVNGLGAIVASVNPVDKLHANAISDPEFANDNVVEKFDVFDISDTTHVAVAPESQVIRLISHSAVLPSFSCKVLPFEWNRPLLASHVSIAVQDLSKSCFASAVFLVAPVNEYCAIVLMLTFHRPYKCPRD